VSRELDRLESPRGYSRVGLLKEYFMSTARVCLPSLRNNRLLSLKVTPIAALEYGKGKTLKNLFLFEGISVLTYGWSGQGFYAEANYENYHRGLEAWKSATESYQPTCRPSSRGRPLGGGPYWVRFSLLTVPDRRLRISEAASRIYTYYREAA
jgi:hypothetical protein